MNLFKKETSFRKKPLNLNLSDEFLFLHEYKKEFDLVEFEHIKKCSISSKGLLFRGFNIYMPYFNIKPNFITLIKSYFLFFFEFSYFKSYCEKNTYLVTNSNSLNFFHWHLDVLPKLEILNIPVVKNKVYLPAAYNTSFYKESIKIFSEIDFFFLDECAILKDVIYIKDTAPTGNFLPSLINNLHKRIIASVSSCFKHESEPLKLYISRKNAKIRRILNEEQYVEELMKLGFIILYMEDLTYLEQIQYSAKSSVILSIHGAGLTHMLFMKPGSKVIEIRADGDSSNNCYYSLASELNHDYCYVKARPRDYFKSTQENDFVLNEDFIYNVKNILAL